MHYQAIRHTLFAYLAALEEDLREIVQHQVANSSVISTVFSEQRVIELKRDGVDIQNISEILLSLDFAEPWQIISSNRNLIDKDVYAFISKHIRNIESYVSLRNTVMHGRPIDPSGLGQIIELVEDIQKTNPTNFQATKRTHRNIRIDPSAAIDIPLEFDRSADRIQHNLPVPDFDETGLIGRDRELENLEKLIRGPYPIMTLVGEGGIGKTALAVRLAYRILDDPSYDFDTIIWQSAKANKLMPNEISRLNTNIKSSVDLLNNVGEILGTKENYQSSFDELLTYLNEFKILLIIDNLETIIDQNLLNFLGNIVSRDSKILLTSRVGIGQFEYPYAVKPLNERDSVSLIRALANVRAVEHLTKCSNKKLLEYTAKLLHSPGFIKWYVSLVQMGSSPEQALTNPELFLEFALENVLNKISAEALFIAQHLALNQLPKSISEIAFLTNTQGDLLRKAVMELCAANIVSLSTTHSNAIPISSYQISDLARTYISSKFPLDETLKFDARKKLKEIDYLRSRVEAQDSLTDDKQYGLNHIRFRNQGDAVVGKTLRQALTYSYEKKFDEALKLIEEAKTVSPDFSEVYRVAGQIYYYANNYALAEENYEIALELEDQSPALFYFYAGFKLRALSEPSHAAELLQKAQNLDPNSQNISVELARAFLYLDKFSNSLRLLSPIISDENTNLKTARVCADVMLQNYLRQLTNAVRLGKGPESIKIFSRGCEAILGLKNRCFDNKITQKIFDYLTVSSDIPRFVFDPSVLGQYSHKVSELKDLLDSKSDENFVYYTMAKPIQSIESDGEAEVIYKGLTGPCIARDINKNFGFLFCDNLGDELYFRVGRLEGIKNGVELEFDVIRSKGKQLAKITKVLENSYGKNTEAVSINSLENDKVELLFEDDTSVKILQSTLINLGVNPKMMKGERINVTWFCVPSKRHPIICDIELTENQLLKFKINLSSERISGTVSRINHDDTRDNYYIVAHDLQLSVLFQRKDIQRPYSITCLEVGSEVLFKLLFVGGRLLAKDIRPTEIHLPTIDYKYKSGVLKNRVGKDSTYGFAILDNKWDVLVRKVDFVNPEEWETIEPGQQLFFQLTQDSDKGIRALNVKVQHLP